MSSFLEAMPPVRREVILHIMDVMADAEKQGKDPDVVARLVFPGTPNTVLAQARLLLRMERTEAWWQTMERMIDGEVIRNAIAAAVPS